MSAPLFEIGGELLSLALDAASERALAGDLTAFRAGTTGRPRARLRVIASDVRPTQAAEELLGPDGVEGWAAAEPDGLAVWTPGRAGFFGGLRVLLCRLFRPPRYLVVHGAGLRLGHGALVAVGPSGAGKSTLCELFAEADSLSDELVILEASDPPRVHATPVRSRCERSPSAGSAELRAVLALEKAPEPSLRELGGAEAAALVLEQSFGDEALALVGRIEAAARLLERSRCAALSFRKDRSCVPLLRGLLS